MTKAVSIVVSIGLLIGLDRAAEFWKQSRAKTGAEHPGQMNRTGTADTNSTNMVFTTTSFGHPTDID
jgi:hypothetical protein